MRKRERVKIQKRVNEMKERDTHSQRDRRERGREREEIVKRKRE